VAAAATVALGVAAKLLVPGLVGYLAGGVSGLVLFRLLRRAS
jgi:hypothetical protein